MLDDIVHLLRIAHSDYPRLSRDEQREALARAIAGDRAGRDALVGSCLGWIAKIARRRSGRFHVDFDDSFQDSVIAALEQVTKHNPDRGAVTTYMTFSVLHGMRSQLTEHAKDGKLERLSGEDGGIQIVDSEPTERDDRVDILMRRMELLDDRARDVVLRWMHSETLEEIGVFYGFSKERTRQILDRALTVLRGGTALNPPVRTYRK